jgi:hypothetical protein
MNPFLKRTKIFYELWSFAHARHEIWRRRQEGQPPPWTRDPVLQKHRFTNVFRVVDRVSQYLISTVIPLGSQEPEELFFRTFLFKIFNTECAWKVLTAAVGMPTWKDFAFEDYALALDKAFARRVPIWSSAYMQKPQVCENLGPRKHRRYLGLVRYAMEQRMAEKLTQSPSYETCFWAFRNTLPIHGDFLSMQHACDCNYSSLINFDENNFIRCGPGALGGLNKCFGLNLDPAREFDMQVAARTVRDLVSDQENWFTRLGLNPVTLFGRPLSLIVLQNCLCELDKITRVTHPQYNGARTKIKHTYDPAKAQPLPSLALPAKWGISLPALEEEVNP